MPLPSPGRLEEYARKGVELLLRTEVDLETGQVDIEDLGR